MTYDDILGFYRPSFFSFRLNTTLPINPLDDLPLPFISTYYHEYFHFLQDLTTSYGFHAAWNTFDHPLLLIESIQKGPDDIELPLKDKKLVNDISIKRSLHLQTMGSKIPSPPVNQDFEINNISIAPNTDATNIPTELNLFVRITIQNSDLQESTFWFGSLAVNETMTYIIQSKFFDTSDTPFFPYQTGIFLAEYLSPQFKGNNEYVFALCDVSLFSPYPGKSFYEILVEIEKEEFKIKKAEDIYTFGMEFIESKYGLWKKFEEAKNGLVHYMSNLFGHEIFKSEKLWVTHIINAGYEMRKNDPTYMLKLYRCEIPFSDLLLSIKDTLGTPEIMNAENLRWFTPPKVLQEKDYTIHALFLLGFNQIQNLLLNNSKSCNLLNHCEGSHTEMPIDQNCTSSPWLKIDQEMLCPFAALWMSFGLNTKTISFLNTPNTIE
jgi:hypothetical protein